MGSRTQNERKFGHWRDLPGGGRRYWFEIGGRRGWSARYVKVVDSTERTIAFWREILDDGGGLVEVHRKFPVDEGHRKA